MTSRSYYQLNHNHRESFELATRTPRYRQITAEAPEEDLNPDSDASLLRRHFDDQGGDDSEDDSEKITASNPLRRFLAFMSRNPLISRFSGLPSYGALPTQEDIATDEVVNGASSNASGLEDGKGKASRLQSAESSERLRHDPGFDGGSARNRNVAQTQHSNAAKHLQNVRDSIIGVDGEPANGDDENPSDNSKSVCFHSVNIVF